MRVRLYQSDVIAVPDPNVRVCLKIRRLKLFYSDGTFRVMHRQVVQHPAR